MFVWKLPRFFTRLYGEGKRAAISKLTYIWTLLMLSLLQEFYEPSPNRLGSRFWVNKTSQISKRYSDQMQAVMKQKSCPI